MIEKDFLIGAVNHHSWADICCWLRSARATGFKGQVVLICYEDTSPSTLRRLAKEGVRVVSLELRGSVLQQRWSDIEELLRNESLFPADSRIVATDVRDVAFQSSLHDFLDSTLSKNDLVLFSEGWRYKNSEWNTGDLRQNFPELEPIMSDREVVCAGVIAGRLPAFRQFAIDVSEQCKLARTRLGDQICANIVIDRWEKSEKGIAIVNSLEPLCCHFGVCAPESVPAYQQYGLKPAPRYDYSRRQAVTDAGQPYSVFHQYTKLPKVRLDVLAKNRCLGTFYLGKAREAIKSRLPWKKRTVPFWMRPEVVNANAGDGKSTT